MSRLVENLNHYLDDYGTDETCVIAINALKEYVDFNTSNGFEELTLYPKSEEFFFTSGMQRL